MSRVLERLLRKGYIRRASPEGDRRQKLISLTSEGWNALPLATNRLGNVLSRAFAFIPMEELAHLEGMLDVVHERRSERRFDGHTLAAHAGR